MAPITSVAPAVEQTDFDPTAGWESLLVVLVMFVAVAIAVLVAFGIGAWRTSRRARLAGGPVESDDDPSFL